MKTETKPKPKKEKDPEIIRFRITNDKNIVLEASPFLFSSPHVGMVLVRQAQSLLENLAKEIVRAAIP